jgi:ssDNA-binding Zn-finger/Zn-ribbon topoisomerase 1
MQSQEALWAKRKQSTRKGTCPNCHLGGMILYTPPQKGSIEATLTCPYCNHTWKVKEGQEKNNA